MRAIWHCAVQYDHIPRWQHQEMQLLRSGPLQFLCLYYSWVDKTRQLLIFATYVVSHSLNTLLITAH